MLISDTEVVQEVPGWQEGDPQEETERPAQLWDEGDGGEGPDLPLYPHISGAEAVPDFEVTAQTERGEFILLPPDFPLPTCLRDQLYELVESVHWEVSLPVCIPGKDNLIMIRTIHR